MKTAKEAIYSFYLAFLELKGIVENNPNLFWEDKRDLYKFLDLDVCEFMNELEGERRS